MQLKMYGADRLGRMVDECCAMARRLEAAIVAQPLLELAAPVSLNIVCFRYRPGDDAKQADIAADLQEAGKVVLSTTTLHGSTVLRAAFVNHRTRAADVDTIIPDILAAAG